MEAKGPMSQSKKNAKKKRQINNMDIVYFKHGVMQTVPSLTKRLKTVNDPVIGLQYVWEYRSPTKSVQPHYQCRLCKVQRLQNEMASHITGWKHRFRYLKHTCPDKLPYDEEQVLKDPAIRKAIRDMAAEVEQSKGRGQIMTVTKEPGDVQAFQDMKTAQRPVNVSAPGMMGPMSRGSGGSFGAGFPEPLFSGEFSPRSGLMSDFPSLRSGIGDNFGQDSMQRFSNRSMSMDSDVFGMGLRNEGMGRLYPNDLPMNSSRDNMMGQRDTESSGTLGTLLSCLDTFRIECEDDAQIVLKITQKLTDVLMEYRLRSISSGSGMNSSSSSSLGNMNFASRMPLSSSDRFSDRFTGDRFSDSGPSRYFN